ncbi:DUF7553 family protein [Halopiger djelfimassiliensis]|uniref:DUF7553 family protein n=1 Tax=Halopiger djelfimassiliensis TaxID=1293047 RepID=UPI0006777540|nr:hypothetical protein [Halopiger djelfimassiliensis]
MNKHFHDSLYYLTRAGEHAKLGIRTTLESVRERVRELTGREPEPEPNRLETLRAELTALEENAEGRARDAVKRARRTLGASRSNGASAER